jgi:hypothetical protein
MHQLAPSLLVVLTMLLVLVLPGPSLAAAQQQQQQQQGRKETAAVGAVPVVKVSCAVLDPLLAALWLGVLGLGQIPIGVQ